MNQINNRIQMSLLTKEEQAQFCGKAKKRGVYEYYNAKKWHSTATDKFFEYDSTYRLIIKDDEWYYTEFDGGGENTVNIIERTMVGSTLKKVGPNGYMTIRLATPAEIQAAKPKELSLEERVKAEYGEYEVVMLEWKASRLTFGRLCDEWIHTSAQSMKGFHMYVYQNLSGNFELFRRPTNTNHNQGTTLPLACLFTKDSE